MVALVPVAVKHQPRRGPLDGVPQQVPHLLALREDPSRDQRLRQSLQPRHAGGGVMAEQHVEAVGRVVTEPAQVVPGRRLVVSPAVWRELWDELVGADGAAESATASPAPSPSAAAVGPPQRPAEVQRPPRGARLGHVRPLRIGGEAGPGLVVAVDHDDRQRRSHGQPHQRRPRAGGEALYVGPRPGAPRAVLQPEVADGNHCITAFAFSSSQRRPQRAVAVVDVPEHENPPHGAVSDGRILRPSPSRPPPAAQERLLRDVSQSLLHHPSQSMNCILASPGPRSGILALARVGSDARRP